MWWIGFHAVLFWFLFWDFYKNTDLVRRAAAKKHTNGVNSTNNTSTFLACSPTESFINGMNNEAHENNHANGNIAGDKLSNGVKNGRVNGVKDAKKNL